MIHEMKLNPGPFEAIKAGRKDIEMRLYDKKRKIFKEGDVIMFIHTETGEKLFAEVLNLYVFNNFEELYANFDKTRLGYLPEEEANPKDMEQYYSPDLIKENQVVGIEIQTI